MASESASLQLRESAVALVQLITRPASLRAQTDFVVIDDSHLSRPGWAHTRDQTVDRHVSARAQSSDAGCWDAGSGDDDHVEKLVYVPEVYEIVSRFGENLHPSDPVLDPRALREYEKELARLDGLGGRATPAEQEARDFIRREHRLRTFGGRSHPLLKSQAEKQRQADWQAINRSLTRIQEQAPTMAALLRGEIRTGRTTTYQGPRWELRLVVTPVGETEVDK